MKTLKQQVKEYLEIEKRFRERHNKDRGIVNILIRKNKELQNIDKAVLTKVCHDYGTMDRIWRQTLEQNPHLRGSDYNLKATLEIKKQKELGYYQN